MKILFHFENDIDREMERALRAALPEAEIDVWPDCRNPESIECAVVWNAPDAFFESLSSLRYIFSLGAGVDHVLKHRAVPARIPLIRLEDAGMAQKMAEYVLYGVLHAHRRMTELGHSQHRQHWHDDIAIKAATDFQVGILGAGVLGLAVAERLVANHYQVSCWSRRPKNLPESLASAVLYHGERGLDAMISQSDALVCLLPLTDDTRGIIDAPLLARTPPGVFVINAARGAHVIDQDLLAALDNGQVSGALLDVMQPEPLPKDHPFWSHPGIILTPHIAAPTQHAESAKQVASKYQQLMRGEPVSGLVERDRGY